MTTTQLPVDIQRLVIDFVGEIEEEEDQACKRALMACTLVNRTWYRRSMQYLWRSIMLSYQKHCYEMEQNDFVARRTSRTLDLLSIILSNLDLARSIKSFTLLLDVYNYTEVFDGNPALLALCTFFPTVPEFRLNTGGSWWKEGEACVKTLRNRDHTLSQAIYPFLLSPELTTMHLSGRNIPLDLLQVTPNLLHARFKDIHGASIPKVWRELPFRLQTVEFCAAKAMLSALLEKAPHVFRTLEDVAVSCGDEEEVDEDCAKLLVLPRGTLRKVNVYVMHCGNFLKHALVKDRGGSPGFGWLQHLTHLFVDIGRSFSDDAIDLWDDIWDAVEDLRSFRDIQILDITLRNLRIPHLKRLCNPSGRGWKLLRQLLHPDLAPSLTDVLFTVIWVHDRDGGTGGTPSDIIQAANGKIIEMVKKLIEGQCLPKWEGDLRKVSISCVVKKSDK